MFYNTERCVISHNAHSAIIYEHWQVVKNTNVLYKIGDKLCVSVIYSCPFGPDGVIGLNNYAGILFEHFGCTETV